MLIQPEEMLVAVYLNKIWILLPIIIVWLFVHMSVINSHLILLQETRGNFTCSVHYPDIYFTVTLVETKVTESFWMNRDPPWIIITTTNQISVKMTCYTSSWIIILLNLKAIDNLCSVTLYTALNFTGVRKAWADVCYKSTLKHEWSVFRLNQIRIKQKENQLMNRILCSSSTSFMQAPEMSTLWPLTKTKATTEDYLKRQNMD